MRNRLEPAAVVPLEVGEELLKVLPVGPEGVGRGPPDRLEIAEERLDLGFPVGLDGSGFLGLDAQTLSLPSGPPGGGPKPCLPAAFSTS